MKCPKCQHKSSRVIDSRPADNNEAIRRRRECEACGYRFTTFERIDVSTIFVKKHSGDTEPFDKEKILIGIVRSAAKRNISLEVMHQIVDRIETTIQMKDIHEITSERIGQMVLEELKSLDLVTYIRFASVYQRFDDVTSFINTLHQLNRGDDDGTND